MPTTNMVIPEIEKYEPGEIYVFKLYKCDPGNLVTLLANVAEDESLPRIRFTSEQTNLYAVEYHGQESNADDYVRIVEGFGRKLQVWAARQASLVELVLLKGKIDYDVGVIHMPLKQAFFEHATSLNLEKRVLRKVRHS